MTVTSARYLELASNSELMPERAEPKPPPRIWCSVDPPFKGYHAAPSEGYRQTSQETAIVIDNGQFFDPAT